MHKSPLTLYHPLPPRGPGLLLKTQFLDQGAVGTLVSGLEILQMRATCCNKTQKASAGVLILAILVEMSGKFFDAACENGDLDLRGPSVVIVSADFADFVRLLALRQHGTILSHPGNFCKC